MTHPCPAPHKGHTPPQLQGPNYTPEGLSHWNRTRQQRASLLLWCLRAQPQSHHIQGYRASLRKEHLRTGVMPRSAKDCRKRCVQGAGQGKVQKARGHEAAHGKAPPNFRHHSVSRQTGNCCLPGVLSGEAFEASDFDVHCQLYSIMFHCYIEIWLTLNCILLLPVMKLNDSSASDLGKLSCCALSSVQICRTGVFQVANLCFKGR